MSRTYRRNKKDFIQKQANKQYYHPSDNAFIHMADDSKEINEDEYLVRTLIFKDGSRKKYKHAKNGWRYSPSYQRFGEDTGSFHEESYETRDVFGGLVDFRGYSVPKGFRKMLENSYRSKAKMSIISWMKNPNEDNDIYIPSVKKMYSAGWLYW